MPRQSSRHMVISFGVDVITLINIMNFQIHKIQGKWPYSFLIDSNIPNYSSWIPRRLAELKDGSVISVTVTDYQNKTRMEKRFKLVEL